MNDIIMSYLKNKKNKSIALMELSNIIPGDTKYEEFAKIIKNLEMQNILIPVKSHGLNGKSISIYNTYKINKGYFKSLICDEIHKLNFEINSEIHLENYYSLDEEYFKQDLPFIKIIDNYICKNGIPKNYAFSPQRSYEIMGDEKWIDEKGGKAILLRIELWEKLKIQYKCDPLMLGINPKKINNHNLKHIILENKSSFYDFLDILEDTDFFCVIYGSGWKIISNIKMLEKQLGLKGKNNEIYYFGDLDYEGISIWNLLKEKENVKLAKLFYLELMKNPYTFGKENQNKNKEAFLNFLQCFDEEQSNHIEELFQKGGYYPQELLTRDEIKNLWRKY